MIVGVLMVAGCGSGGAPGDAGRIDARLVAELEPGDARAVGDAVNAFAFDLFSEVTDGRENAVTAPLSMTVLLSMILAGADGTTADQIAKALHLSDRRDVRVGALLRKLADTDEVTLSVANSLWADEGRPFEEDYLTFLRRTLGATAEERDLGSPGTAEEIDAWAGKNTNGLIDKIAGDLGLPNPDAALVLLNAVYFLGEWKTQFDKGDTRPETFEGVGEVPTMHLADKKFGYVERDGYRMLRMPYGEDGRYGMEILLPDESLPSLLGSLDAAEWRAAVDGLTEQTLDEVAVPRFELRWKGEMTPALRKLGVSAAFTPGEADFRPMSPVEPWLETVMHKTYIKVDEKGTEAAAVSGGSMATSAQINQRVFRVDRPFAFTISDRETGTVLFLGAVTDPRS
ncbi:serpin family protein [Actinoplanes sp. GCM10030250]|uniref:serpin family protein n=1 Tax=Actinoplanes sp. GCM10030250 TaxID=3273376 RepID=UPI0036185188